ncbi:MAG: nitrite/sulfite reductase [Verrucomicrobiota bacterium]
MENELNELADLIARLQRGEWTRAEFRGHSVHYGVYTQRQTDRFFVRMRVPYGIISPLQLTALAAAIETWGRDECHFTTRQGVEVHDLRLEQVVPFLRALAQAGLLSHETGGNSIRSILVCPHAGVGTDEPFDVTPYAELLTRYFVRHPDFQTLPRKMKIAFSGCERDCVRSFAQDLGFQARKNANGECGFRVLAGGGTGALPRLGQELIEFLPAEQMCSFTEAFLRVFNRLGDRQNRRRARVKFLVQSLGIQALLEEITRERTELQREQKSYPSLGPVSESPAEPVPGLAKSESLERAEKQPAEDETFSSWVTVQTQPQPQRGFRTVRVSLAAGSITAGQLRQLAALSERFRLAIRTTPEQGFLLRQARDNQLSQIYQALDGAQLLHRLAVSRLVACPGSKACSNAFTNTPALAQAITARLALLPDPTDTLAQLSIRLCGCSNGCGLHAVADIGLEGLANRAQNDWLPAYRLWLGGRESQSRPRFGEDLGMMPARHVPACVADVAEFYLASRQPGESLADLLDRVGVGPFSTLLKKHQLEPAHDRRELAIDWGEAERYRPRGVNEAGVC